MKIQSFLAFVSVFSYLAVSQSPPSIAPQIVVVPSGNLRLKGYFWRPVGPAPSPAVLFVHGSGSTDASHTGGFPITEAAERLAPTFIKHGYAFLYLFRRGQGLSADQGPFMQDVLQHEKDTNGEEARKRLQFVLLTKDHLDDVTAGVVFEKPTRSRFPSHCGRRALVRRSTHPPGGRAR